MEATIEDLERELWLRRRNLGQITWKTKDGKEIPINQMSDEHIENSIKLIMRMEEYRDISLEYESYVSEFE